eukprot:TRINITY_DN64901_c1_g1_i2.p1 TRINITY_DN64901_c1_g1~~TRINITY_DN64901_c1_g1_i2.p1  ORF type:complete len:173 (-),score=22.96 TRINITY_DN64901_c1_g1_i2:128-646(-)
MSKGAFPVRGSFQDWAPITLKKPEPKQAKKQRRTEAAIAATAHQPQKISTNGTMIASVVPGRKFGAGQNRQNTINGYARKLEESETTKHNQVCFEVARAIQQGRQNKGNMTQKELAQAINERPAVVAEYESRKAIPNQTILSKMERALGIKLRGKSIGEDLHPSKAKTTTAS